jgi:hypothetical protein
MSVTIIRCITGHHAVSVFVTMMGADVDGVARQNKRPVWQSCLSLVNFRLFFEGDHPAIFFPAPLDHPFH